MRKLQFYWLKKVLAEEQTFGQIKSLILKSFKTLGYKKVKSASIKRSLK